MNIGAPMTGKVSRPCITAGIGMRQGSWDSAIYAAVKAGLQIDAARLGEAMFLEPEEAVKKLKSRSGHVLRLRSGRGQILMEFSFTPSDR
jgi:hypothetical protein